MSPLLPSVPVIDRVVASAFTIPTDGPEADGSLAWIRTTLFMAEVSAAGKTGTGYSYTDAAAAAFVNQTLAPVLVGGDAFAVTKLWQDMVRAVRNIGRRGLAATAISALDIALWDLKARLLDLPLTQLLGAARPTVPIYGSGGFTSYSLERLQEQLSGWIERGGCSWVKMKVGSEPECDVRRMAAARDAIGSAGLFVDANGAYDRKQALDFATRFEELGVSWFEEPVSSDDLAGLRLLRDRARIEIAAGEYGYETFYFKRMLEVGAVDVLQIDATRCGGITGFLRAAALADAYSVPVSSHTAPAVHLDVCCAAPGVRHVEWFHDHVRIEQRLFDGAPRPVEGRIRPDPSRPGHGLEFKHRDAEDLAA